jgi:integral membrane protein (TIGR01906 family)
VSRAPAGVGVVFGVALALAVTLTGPLLLFNPWFTSVLQSRHQVAAAFDTSQAEVDRVTGLLLGDLYLDGDFQASFTPGEPLLDGRERSHMSDVSRLVRILAGITLAALILAVVTGAWLRNERARQGRIIVTAAAVVGTVAVVLAGIFAVAFEPAFLAFHAIFFPPGTYLFPEGSQLIVLFPEGFWFDAALVAGAAIALTALVASAIGFARWRSGRDDAPSSLI